MQSLEKTKLVLLTQSKNLLQFAKQQDEVAFFALNSQFQTAFKDAVETFGDKINPILPALIADNDELMVIISQKQKDLAKERASQLKNLKQVKAYLKESK